VLHYLKILVPAIYSREVVKITPAMYGALRLEVISSCVWGSIVLLSNVEIEGPIKDYVPNKLSCCNPRAKC
jgi:uncharacterized membrane protein